MTHLTRRQHGGISVTVRSDSREWTARLVKLLEARGHRATIFDLHTNPVANPGLLVVHAPVLRALEAGALGDQKISILVTGDDLDNLRLLGGISAEQVLFETEIERIPEALATLARPSPVGVFSTAVAARSVGPPALRAALRALVRVASGPPSPVLRNVKELAREVGCCADYLGRVSKSEGIVLRPLIDAAMVVRASQIFQAEAQRSVVRRDLAYSTESALYGLFSRVVGGPPRALNEDRTMILSALIGYALSVRSDQENERRVERWRASS